MTLYAPYGVYAETEENTGAPALVGGITRQRLYTDTEADHEVSAGNYNPYTVVINEQKPKAEFTTRDLDGILGVLAPPGSKIETTGTSPAGVQCFQVKKTDGKIDSGSVHRMWKFAAGIMIPRRLSIQQGGNAEFTAEVLGRYDGTNEPIAPNESQALAGTLTDPARWSMGIVTLGAVSGGIVGKQSLEIDFGVNADQVGEDGEVWPENIDLDAYLARITIGSIDTSLVAAAKIPLVGKAATHANTKIDLRKRDGGGFASGSVHINVTVDGLCYADNVFDADGNQRGTCDLVCLARYDGSNAPLVISTGQALQA